MPVTLLNVAYRVKLLRINMDEAHLIQVLPAVRAAPTVASLKQ